MSNRCASTSNGGAAAIAASAQQQILANNAAQIIAAHGQVLQIDHKKVQVFLGEKVKDYMMVIPWCACMNTMKTSLGCSNKGTFCNTTGALIINAQQVVNNLAILDKDDYGKTWTCLKKAINKHWGDMKDSRSYIDDLVRVGQRTNNFNNLDPFTSGVMDASEWSVRPCPNRMSKRSRPLPSYPLVRGSGKETCLHERLCQ